MQTVGIDFGTTNSTIACVDPDAGRARVVTDALGNDKTPSVVYFGEASTLVGTEALDVLEHASGDFLTQARVIRSIKRNLLEPPQIALPEGRMVTPGRSVR